MKRQYDVTSIPNDPIFVRGFMSAEDCEKVKAMDLEFRPGSIFVDGKVVVETSVRKCTNALVSHDDPLYERIFNRVVGSPESMGFDITGMQYMKVARYGPGDYFIEHCDDVPVAWSSAFRKLIMIIALTTQGRDHFGGSLYINDRKYLMQTGDAVFFRPNMPHRVTEVQAGERVVLATLFTGPRFR